MTASHPGGITTQGEILFRYFSKENAPGFMATSDKRSRYHRLWDMVRTLWNGRDDIGIQCLSVYSGPSFVVADICSRVGRRLGQRLILHLHGGGLPDFFTTHPSWARKVLSRAHAIVAPSAFLARAAERLGFAPLVIPNVIDLDDYPFHLRSQVGPRLFWMRSFHPVWNPAMAVRVLARLRSDHVSASMVMGGPDKGQLDETRQLAASLGVAECVEFAGFLGPKEKARAGSAAEIFLNTNRIDNMPVAVLEACAMGLPVVSTNVGGIPDLLTQEKTGLLVANEDDAAMASAVKRLLQDHALCSLLSTNGRRLAEQSAWPVVRKQWLGLFERLVPTTPVDRRSQ